MSTETKDTKPTTESTSNYTFILKDVEGKKGATRIEKANKQEDLKKV